ncbi:hypothetical protein [Bradyrhizobium sp. CCBAU 51765]|uniref:hypothetical protein n=1 Tax=Bradyrhizobium sp. CCBAU 51765 TaxID=1325102 RepID=UPI001886DBB7|nr:hypothetical protein [Bradyrhizobium sp. CCBAU 51765]
MTMHLQFGQKLQYVTFGGSVAARAAKLLVSENPSKPEVTQVSTCLAAKRG